MTQDDKNDGLLTWLAGFIVLVILIAELLLPLGDAGGWLYILGMVVILWIVKPDQVRMFGLACAVAAMLGFFLTADFSEGVTMGLVHRLMSVFAIGAVTVLINRQGELETDMKRQQAHLNSVVEKRTEGLKQIVDQLDETRIRLTEAEELGRFGFWEYHPASQEMIWSPGVFGIYSYPVTPKAPSMQEFLERCHTEDVQRLQQAIQFAMAEQKAYTVEYRIVLPDNSMRWIYNRGRPVVDGRGRIEMVVGTIQDITDRKVSEAESDEKYQRYNSLFHNAAVAKALIIPNKVILDANVALSRWVGYSIEELKRMPLEQLMHEDDRSMEDVYAREMIIGEIDFFQQEKRFVHKGGKEMWGLFSVSAVHDENDKVTSFAAEIIDITRRKEAETALRKAEVSWREAEEALTQAEARIRSESTSQDDSDAALAARDEEIETLQALVHEFENAHVDSEAALSLAEGVVENLFAVSGEMLCLIGTEGSYRRVSPQFQRRLGLAPDALEEQLVLDFVHEDDRQSVQKQFTSLQRGESISRFGFRHRRHDGTFASVTFDAIPRSEHDVFYAVLRMASSLREEPVREQSMREQSMREQSMREQPVREEPVREEPVRETPVAAPRARAARARPKADVRPLTDQLPFLIWMQDADRRCTYVNKKVRDFTGMPFEQLEGAGWSSGVSRMDHARYIEHYNEHFERWEPMHLAYRHRRHDGVERWLLEACVPLRDEQGACAGYLCTGIDITALKTVESQFIRAVEEAVDLSDLTSALQTCRRDDNTTVLSDNVKIADALVEYAAGINHEDLKALMEHAGRQLHQAITGVLDFSGVRTPGSSISYHKVLLEKVTARTLDIVQPLTMGEGPQLSEEVHLSDIMVLTDELMLHRILENVLRQLLPHTRTGMIGIELNADDDVGFVRIKDIGPVLPPHFLDNLADNYRKKSANAGTFMRAAGLELSLARKLVELMKGMVSIRDVPHHGTEITFGFPLAEDPFARATGDALPEDMGKRAPAITGQTVASDAERVPAPAQRRHRGEASTQRNGSSEAVAVATGPRVLVAEANGEIQRVIRSLLQPYYALKMVPTAADILEEARQVTYDLLVIDVHLEGDLTGVELFHKLRSMPQYANTPAIAIAYDSDGFTAADALQRAGFDGFLQKPFSIVELLDTVEKAIAA